MVVIEPLIDDIHSFGRGLAHHRAMAVVRLGSFRDTAHGFLAWALASILVAAFATSSVSSAVSSAGRAISGAASTATQAVASQTSGDTGYFLDILFRKDQPDTNVSSQDARAEGGRIPIAARTGISQQDAEKRIDDAMAQIKTAEEKTKQAANEARKASAKASFYLFFSMLIGAFIASAAGALGGRQRDEI
jgi:hypothetical protein